MDNRYDTVTPIVKSSVLCLLCAVFLFFAFQGCKSKTSLMREGAPSDSELAAQIKSRIAEAGLPPVRVFAIQGRVALSGVAPNREAKEKMLAIARDTPDVLSVSDDLQIKKIQ